MTTPLSTARLWELLSERLRGFFLRRVSDPQLAEDLLQETFLRIHKGLENLTDEERLESWVFQIARNLLIDHRRTRSLPTTEAALLDQQTTPEPPDADNLNDVVRDWLPAMIAQLPSQYAEADRLPRPLAGVAGSPR